MLHSHQNYQISLFAITGCQTVRKKTITEKKQNIQRKNYKQTMTVDISFISYKNISAGFYNLAITITLTATT